LKKLVTDVNIAVAVEAVQAIGNLASGLRKDFTSGSKLLLPVLLDKLKEKKQVMVDALTTTLNSIHKGGCIQLLDVIEDVKLAAKNKVPLVRSSCLTWVATCIETSTKPTVLKLHKEYVPILMEGLNDSSPEVRDAAFLALAAFAKVVGMKVLERPLEKLDEVRKKKLIELCGVESTTPAAAAPAFSRAQADANGSSQANGGVKATSAASLLSGKRPVSAISKKSSTTSGGASKSGGAKKSEGSSAAAKSQAEAPEDVEPGEMSLEDIESRLGPLFEPEVFANLKSANWKERLEAITSLKDTVEGLKTLDQHAELLIRLLCVLPGWNEKNIQVQQKAIEAVILIAQNATRFSKKCVVLCLTGVVEKVGDIKTRIQATKCLTTFCEAVGPKFIFERLFKIMKDHKNPKVLSEGLSWMMTALDDFGIGHVPLKDLINFCKDTGLGSSAAPVRTATVKLFGVLHKFVGPDLKGFLTDVKPQLQTMIDAEIEKNPYEGPASAPKRAIRAVDVGAPTGGTDGLPREDISAKLTPALLKNMSSADWKLRQESLEVLNGIIEEAHKRIQPTGTGELFMSLKARLNDSNKNLVIMTLATLGTIATAMGPVVEKHSKGILGDALKCLGDNKKVVREAVVKMLDAWVLLLQLDKMLPYIIPALVEAKIAAEGRKDLFEWVSRNIAKQGDQPVLLQLVKPISMGLQDKFVDMRKSAEACLIELIRVFDVEAVMKASKGVQGSALAALQTVFDHQRSSSASEDSFTSASTTPKAGSKGPTSEVRASSRNPSTIGRGAATRQSGPKQTKTSATLAAEAYDSQMAGQPLFNLKDSHKAERERLNFRKYKFDDAARREQPHDVEADIVKFFREDLQKKLLSPDFKKQIDGLELLQRAIPNQTKEIIEILDVIFRWSSLRFAESNTTCLLKVIDFLFDLVEGLKGEAYMFSEFEASILFPCLVEKSGHNIEKVREKIRELTRLLCSIYPAPKVFVYMTDGLKSKNNRTRIECVENIEFMIEQCGVEIVGSTKALASIAALTVERDGDIRKASLAALATAYKILGEDIWRYVGKITGAQKGVMDEKFKWTAREMDKRKEGKPGGARAEEARALEARADEGRASVKRSAVDTSSGSSNGHIEVGIEGPHGNLRQSSPLDWNEALDIINNATSSEQVVDGLKLVCHELAKAAGDPDSGALDELANDADLLVTTLFVKVTTTFNLGLAGASSRSCKYVLNTLMQTFQVKKLARAVKEGTLHNLITELLVWLLDERVLLMDDGSQLLKAMNVLMLKILENADRTSAFIVLIYLLRPMGSSKFTGRQQGTAVIRNQKFLDLVVKCLIKLTKVLGSTLLEVDLDRILQSIHEYFEELGMAEIRKRAGADDKPLRMVKTLLHELVKLRGTAIKGHLSLVPIDLEPQPIILAYIDLNLQTLGTVGQTQWSASNNGGSSPSSHSAETQLKQELAAVFKKIGDKQTCTIGLYELYRITQLYPQVDIFSQLQNASEAFRTYISDGIAQMERNAAAGRTFGSIPIATPPPVSSPTVAYNKSATSFQHRGRVQGVESGSHAFEDNSSSTYSDTRSPEYAESLPLKSSAGHNVMANPQGFGDLKPHNQAMGGTLDAIRERMKSIQAGATTGTTNFSSNGSHSRSSSSGDVGEDKALSGLQARMERLKAGGGLEYEITQR
jgi:cytoskeleton-associated protein 5